MSMRKPPRLAKGDLVGVISPASPTFCRSDVQRGAAKLESWGFRVRLGDHVYDRHGYLAGRDEQRLADLNAMIRDPEVRAIIAVRGGYGAGRLLPRIDYEALRRDPKPIVGYSDLTSLHLAVRREAGLVTFYGPMVAAYGSREMSDYKQDYLLRALTSAEPLGEIRHSPQGPDLYTITPGEAAGELVGGCLTLIAQAMGTPWELDTAGKILFLEDVHEEPYRVDNALTQLWLAGKLQQAAGIVIGEFVDCEPNTGFREVGSLSLEDIMDELVRPLGIPAFYGLSIGHGKDLATLPIGVRARLDATRCRLVIEETATA